MTIRLHDPVVLDPNPLFFVDDFQNNPHNAVFGQGLITYPPTGWQYAAWYGADRQVRLARRPGWGQAWDPTVLSLPMALGPNDSHNTIALGYSQNDARLHVCAGAHNGAMQYTRSIAGFLDEGAFWDLSFSPPSSTLLGLVIGNMTYPTFTPTPGGDLLFWWRNGGASSGRLKLARYAEDTWTDLGNVTSSSGTWTAPFKPPPNTSDSRGFYWARPVYGDDGRLHLAGTWREQGDAVLVSYPGVIANRHTVYLYSLDDGETWHNNAGTIVATTGLDPLSTADTSALVDAGTDTRYALQVASLAVGPGGLVGYLPDYVRGSEVGFDGAVSSEAERIQYTAHFPRFRNGSGAWSHRNIESPPGTAVRCRYPTSGGPTGFGRAGRGHLVFGPSGNAYVFYSGFRVWQAAAPGYNAWSLASDWSDELRPFGEAHQPDLSRVSEGLVSFLYGQDAPGAVCVRDFELD